TFTTNPAPTGSAVTAGNATKGVAKSITLPAADGETGFTCSIVAQPGKGAVTLGGASSCTASYIASANENGADSFTYKVTDADGRSSATYTVSLTIVNQAPTGAVQAVSATKGVGLPIALANSDPDGDTTSCSITVAPVKGTLSGTGCSQSYLAPADTFGTDPFTYTVSDGFTTSTTYVVTVTITNQAPTSSAIELSVAAGTAASVVLGGSDPDGDATTCSTTAPTGGTVSAGPACTRSYTAPSTTGTYSFTYTRIDGGGATSPSATVTITVTPAAVHGVVTSDTSGAGIAGITVRLYEDGVGFTPHVATTGATGAYDLGSDIVPGEYRVVFRDPTQTYVDEWFADSVLRSTSTPISFGGALGSIDASLATGAEIDVTIDNPGVYTVALYNTAPTGASAFRSVPNVEGAVSLRGLPAGTYYLSVTDPSGALVTKWSGNRTAREDAQGISVVAGGEAEAPFALLARNTIAGTVIDSESALPFVTVQAYGASSGAFVKSTKTDAEGEYALRGLAAGSYKLAFRDATGAHPVTWSGGGEVIGSAAAVTMTNGGAVTADEELPRIATVTGTVTGGSEGTAPISGAKVTLYRNGAAVKTYVTDGAGAYTATGLAPGAYIALFSATGHRTEYTLDRSRRVDADVVTVDSGGEVTLDATLTPI
ncbi:MAG TPA: Ig-like domain-containing protein, partial [Iamia sp.]|nr:Ig-like domain-containing protein [Iamia sp.]